MNRALLTALFATVSVPALAQEQPPQQQPAPAQESAQQQAAQPQQQQARTALTPEQITAFNQSVADFQAGQKAQQANDAAGASAKYSAALPAIRQAVQAQPANLDFAGLLANTLYANAAAQIALQKPEEGATLLEESVPHWRKISGAKPEDSASRAVLTSILTQVGNVKLSKQDKAGATPLYTEALSNARKLVASQPDATNRNLLLSALVGASQSSNDPKLKTEAATLSKAMIADGTVDQVNKPAAEALQSLAPAS